MPRLLYQSFGSDVRFLFSLFFDRRNRRAIAHMMDTKSLSGGGSPSRQDLKSSRMMKMEKLGILDVFESPNWSRGLFICIQRFTRQISPEYSQWFSITSYGAVR
jgi:hypothetical protein